MADLKVKPMSSPCRFNVVGSWIWKKNSRMLR
jgi:hypothetical protein